MQRIRDILSERARASGDSAEERRHADVMLWTKIGIAAAVVLGLLALLQKCM